MVGTFTFLMVLATVVLTEASAACVATEAELVSFYFTSLDSQVTLCYSTKATPLELTHFLSVERQISVDCEAGTDCQILLASSLAGFGVTDTGPLFMSGVTVTSSPGMELARAAVDIDRDAVATLTNVSFIGLNAFQGPAIQIIGSGATGVCNHCSFSNCSASASGGALHVTRGNSEFTCNQCDFTGNRANTRGGSIDSDQGPNVINLDGCTFVNDEAPMGKSVFVSEFTTLNVATSDLEEVSVQESSNDFEPGGGILSLVRSSVAVVNSAPY